jgi:hypothetical protein
LSLVERDVLAEGLRAFAVAILLFSKEHREKFRQAILYAKAAQDTD